MGLPSQLDGPANIGKDRTSLRVWWHKVLRSVGRYKTYSILLILPRDKAMYEYLAESYEELYVLTGDFNLLLLLSDNHSKEMEEKFINESPYILNKLTWISSVNEHINKGLGKRIAQLFNIKVVDLPGILLFKDIRSDKFVYIKLKDMTVEEISDRFRNIFSIIEEAIRKNIDPLEELSKQAENEKFIKFGKSIVTEVVSGGRKTIGVIIESFINSKFYNP